MSELVSTAGVHQVVDARDVWTPDVAPTDLRRKTARGALLSTAAQGAAFVLRTTSLMILARLLLKEDFGLVNMVTAFTGFLGLLRDAGLSMAAVQSVSITRAQTSTLFWINLAVGGSLALLVTLMAPILAAFYAEPRLLRLTMALATTLVLSSAADQHRAMLQRSMRFGILGAIDIVSLVFGIAVAIGMAVAGYGYWALVALWISQLLVSALGVWLATGWIPGMPQRCPEIRSMLVFGGTITLNGLVVYLAYNIDKVLIGRFWGAEGLGIYGRAYQLINLPTESLNQTIGLVAFPAFSRLQNDPEQLRRYFLKAYGFFLSLVMPITVACALFADDIILVFLGPNWHDAAAIFRTFAPTILAFAFANPLFWLMMARGQAGRSLRIALVLTPLLILSYALGLPYGPHGVATAFSVTMVLSILPVVLGATRGTLITLRDIVAAATPASLSVVVAAAALLALRPLMEGLAPALVRLVADTGLLFSVYLFTLLFVMKQKPMYVQLLSDIDLWPPGRRPVESIYRK